MMLKEQEKQALKKLATEYMEVASLSLFDEKIKLWRALNRGSMERPMVVIDQLPWHELNGAGELNCVVTSDPFWKNFELELRKTLYKWRYFPVDMVIEPFLTIPLCLENSGYGLEIAEQLQVVDGGNDVKSHQYENQLENEEDIAKICDMKIIYDKKQSDAYFDEAKTLFAGIAPVIQSHGLGFRADMWDRLSEYMSVEEVYYAIVDRPEFLHKLMQRLTDATMVGIDSLNQLKLHDDVANTCHCSYIYDDVLLPVSGQGLGPVSQNAWIMGMAQLFTSVSPQVSQEFEFDYVAKLSAKFGGLYYGCCEKLSDRLDRVLLLPNLRKVSCSPWSNWDQFAERIGKKVVMSCKPTPAPFATESFDVEALKKTVEDGVTAAKRHGANVEFILKDLSTIAYDPRRLSLWAEETMKIVQK